jgi:L-fuculose-phosphate aldolase
MALPFNPKDIEAQRHQVASFMRRLYHQHLTTSLGGNVSMKLSDGIVLITPSGIDKGMITGDEVGILGQDGTNHTPHLKLSMEAPMHLAVYKKRMDVSAVVHAHPPTASAFAASHEKINCRLIAETRLMLKEPALAPYARMGTEDLANNVSNAIEKTDSVLMENHGVLTVGASLVLALERLEVLESAAKITLITKQLGNAKEMSCDQLEEIDQVFGE